MKRMVSLIIMTITAVLFAAGNNAEKKDGGRMAPRLLNYQGFLTDTLGNPVTNPSVSMIFSIYDAVSSGNLKWTETIASVGVDKGVFHVLLGGVSTIPDSVFKAGADRWLEMSIAGQTLSPRTRIVSVPYAYSASFADTALYAYGSTPDTKWNFLVSDGADTTLRMGSRWGLARFGNTLYGNVDSTHVNLGVGCVTGTNGQNYKYITVGGGVANNANGNYSTISGGGSNTAGIAATVGGGINNAASWDYATIAGGWNNRATNTYATVGGGSSNEANQSAATVSGGSGNRANNMWSTVSGGAGNFANGNYSFIGGGYQNRISNSYAIICGGESNLASGLYSTVAGGIADTTSGYASTVAGGASNRATGNYATIAGGTNNRAIGSYATIAAGINNTASGHLSMVGGGQNNTTSDSFNFIGAGYLNSTTGKYSTILGGYADTIFSGANYSYLFGINSNLTQDSTFMVDMPHVWFGTEAGGYEFPYGRGTNGQVMVTNGSGQLSWGSVGDNHWSYRITDTADTTLQMGGRWGIARYGNTLYGNADSTHVNLGVQGNTGANGQNYKYSTVGGGYGNTAGNSYATVGGGNSNNASGLYATVAGGTQNSAANQYTTVGGGTQNSASFYLATVGGGMQNNASTNATIAGGVYNSASGLTSTVSGGYQNLAAGTVSAVGGGRYNKARGAYSVVSGGGNATEADSNSAIGDYSSIGGGLANIARGANAVIGGGVFNRANGNDATVGGGTNNNASGYRATIGGGNTNTASNSYTTIGGGSTNIVSGWCATVGGGDVNANAGDWSAILGGFADSIAATGDYSYLFGINSNLTQDSTFMVDMPHVWFGAEANGYELPYGRGTNGQVMVTNGSGILSWGSITYVDSARIAANAHKLQGKDTVDLNIDYVNEGQVNSIANAMIQDGAVTTTKIADTAVVMAKLAPAGASVGQVIKWNGTAWQPSVDSSMDNDWTINGSNMYSAVSGNVGIGTTTPSAKLSVWNGNISVSNGGVYSNTGYWGDVLRTNWGNDLLLRSSYSGKGIIFQTQSGEKMRIDSIGNVGIGVASPAVKLDVAGTVKIADGTQSLGRVFTSDANGLGSWQAIPNDNDWTFLVTDGADTTLQMGGRWGLARAGNVLYGIYDSTHVNLGVACTTGSMGLNGRYSVVSGGWVNKSGGDFTTVGGGEQNSAGGWCATIAGGVGNTTVNDGSTVGGGRTNQAIGHYAVVSGGRNNSAGDAAEDSGAVVAGGLYNLVSGYSATVGGGYDNTASGGFSLTGGGYMNTASGDFATVDGGRNNTASGLRASIGGGWGNTASNYEATVGGGTNNNAGGNQSVISGGGYNITTGTSSAIGGGYGNNTGGSASTVAGGQYNTASGSFGTVAGGGYNKARGDHSTVAGGGSNNEADSNSAIGNYSTIGGGYHNTASGNSTVIGGGYFNAASNWYAVVSGGQNNTASGQYTTVGGGEANIASGHRATVAGGAVNFVAGEYSAILGGYADTIFATGDYSYLFGINSNLTQDSTFMVDMPHVWFGTEAGGYEFPYGRGTNGQVMVTDGSGKLSWGSPTDADWTISGSNMYSAVSGNVGIGASSPAVRLEVRAGTSDTAAIFRGNLVIQSKATGNAVLELGEGLDYAEGFDVSQPEKIKAGTVLVIDPKNPGKLAVSHRAYDTKVAGIVAGGNGLASGVRLGTGDFDHNVALAGRVYCNVDASLAAIEPGDLLTTADTPGYAMKALNYDRAKGAVLGKAMEPLAKGQKGQILVLVSLQ